VVQRPVIKVKPKYRNPGNAEQTWTGRGKQPRWVGEVMATGLTLDDLRIRE
jgi:DNA-binding protein H-NS